MIEFNGCITGVAESFFWSKSRKFVWAVMLVVFLLILPWFVIIAVNTKEFTLLFGYLVASILIFLLTLIPHSKKTEKDLHPKEYLPMANILFAYAINAKNLN
ncbi:MAG: hypothetical protein IJW48_00045 [Clostridia bacterium]|nr:hypothetical protein [Clostridia bacterium]